MAGFVRKIKGQNSKFKDCLSDAPDVIEGAVSVVEPIAVRKPQSDPVTAEAVGDRAGP